MRRRSELPSQRLGDRFLDLIAPHPPVDDLAVRADEDEGRDRHDAEGARDRAVNANPQKGLRPGQLALLLEFPGLVDLLVDAQAEDREPLVLAEGVVDGLEIGDLADARAAPGGPEVEQDVPPLEVARA